MKDNVTNENDVIIVSEETNELTMNKKRTVAVLEQVVSNRTRLPSQYIISPFTVKIKNQPLP